MSLERAIHRHWTAWRPLTSLVPADRVRTGWILATESGEAPFPYVTIERAGRLQTQYLAEGVQLQTITIRFNLWTRELVEGKRIAAEIECRFGRQEFSDGCVRVLDMQLSGHNETFQEDGIWHLELEYLTRSES